MKKLIKSLPHNPKRVLILSFILAISIGVIGYKNINKHLVVETSENINSIVKDISLKFNISGQVKDVLVKQGDKVKRGQILATLNPSNMDGSLAQAEAAYDIAKANYQKAINGATGPTIDIAKAAVNTARVNFEQVTKQQNVLVDNAYRNLLNSTPEAIPSDNEDNYIAPIISGNYNLGKEGKIKLHFYYSAGGISFTASGLTEGNGIMNSIVSQPIGDSGLYIKSTFNVIDEEDWIIEIPNKKSASYTVNRNAYDLAFQTRSQAVAVAQATLDQSNASLTSVITATRSEDIDIAKAQVENAEGILKSNPTYINSIIIAPSDGEVKSINIKSGDVVSSDISIIELKVNDSLN